MKRNKILLLIIFILNITFAAQENIKSVSVWLKENQARQLHEKAITEYQHWAKEKLAAINTPSILNSVLLSKVEIKNEPNKILKRKLFIFVSFSLPIQSLKQWLQQAHQKNATVVLRGFINNSLRETANKMKPLLDETSGGLQINPLLFKRYHIDQVPAVVLENNTGFDVVYGDVLLENALDEINKSHK